MYVMYVMYIVYILIVSNLVKGVGGFAYIYSLHIQDLVSANEYL